MQVRDLGIVDQQRHGTRATRLVDEGLAVRLAAGERRKQESGSTCRESAASADVGIGGRAEAPGEVAFP